MIQGSSTKFVISSKQKTKHVAKIYTFPQLKIHNKNETHQKLVLFSVTFPLTLRVVKNYSYINARITEESYP
jgi:hypothetical protein